MMNTERQTFYHKAEKTFYQGKYRFPVFDSLDRETIWHRLKINITELQGVITETKIYASDNINAGFNAESFVGVFENARDILLHKAKGRYLWFCIEVIGTGSITIQSFELSYPAESLFLYLPEVYSENTFANEYLSIFKTLFDELEDKITSSSVLYDVNCAPDKFARLMASWLAVPDISLWDNKRIYSLTRIAPKYYHIKGTIGGMKLIIKEFCDTEPLFVETFQVMKYYALPGGETLRRIYKDNRFVLWVIITKKLNEKQENAVRYLLLKNKPAFTKVNVLTLNSCLILDFPTYLGINSQLTEYGKASLDGECILNYKSLKG